jgi:hypothetical protein
MSDKGETLTDAMLDSLKPHLRAIQKGRYKRAGCPFHGSDEQRSLSIDTETGRFKCYSCGVWGYTEKSRAEWKARQPETLSRPWERRSGTSERLKADGAEPEPLGADELEHFATAQQRLSEAADYLASRRIPLEVVQRMGGGVGSMAGAPGLRLILPHTDLDGRAVSLYGRRIDGATDRPHHHLGGRPKGVLNGPALRAAEVWLTEGAFDALALLAAGVPNAAAVFGVDGLRWDWLRACRRLVLAFDADEAGRRAITEQAKQAALRGLSVAYITPEELGGAKDIAEAWQRGTLNLA